MTRITSKPSKFIHHNWRQVDFHIDIEGNLGDKNVAAAVRDLKLIAESVTEVGTPTVPWFPTDVEDFDHIGKKTLTVGDGLVDTDHPSFTDPVYRDRRAFIADVAREYSVNDDSIPDVEYTSDEIGVWKHCYPKLKRLLRTNACEETNKTIEMMEKHVEGFSADTIPQLDPISKFLEGETGWRLKPVGGLLSQREFLNALGFKIFHST